ncbi:MAG: riboflavin biosynthesis protein RibF [Chloroflexi bacterium RBG_16_52_11]|nr:MAG: riboflavin biosynthesis protein RibF [Chloroflexi bacterium RBG_16_52_11]
MQHYLSLDGVYLECAWLTIGSFDGVHLGHQAIVRELVAGAKREGASSALLTFHPHPAVILNKRKVANYLTSPEERANLVGELGVDIVITHPFNQDVAAMSARDFIEHLKTHLGFTRMVVGVNFGLGRDREGDIPTLSRLGEELGYSIKTIDPVLNGDEIVSSSRIRARLVEGDVQSSGRLLGRPFRMSGVIVHGDARGKTIGVPTANLDVWSERAFPKSGVYACRALIDGTFWNAVTNVGVRPTFETHLTMPQVEAHLLDFEGDLYGRHVALDFIQYLRDEHKFPNVQALIDQIHQDINRARLILSG